jgi:predicted RNase H-related nuclease YkuK (DUF458 family)
MQLPTDISHTLYMPSTRLLDNFLTQTIAKYLTPEMLLGGAEALGICIAIVVSVIYIYLSKKKRSFFYTERIKNLLKNWLSQIIMEEAEESAEISKKIHKIVHNNTARQFVIDELIRGKKNFSGEVAEKIVSLYQDLKLKEYSLKKLSNKKTWYVKARGIQELYMMDQKDSLVKIYRNTNSKNDMVRTEAQMGVIHLTGFKGLRFLDMISYPITEWQQVKLLQQLRFYPEKEDISAQIPKWLQSKNPSVVVFALKLANEYQIFSVRNDVINCLVHPDKQVRTEAINTIIRLADEKTASVLAGYFYKESFSNQLAILDALDTMATSEEEVFLSGLLDHENDTIKLKAAIVLANNTDNGVSLIEQKAIKQPEPYQRIYRHIKTVK